MIVTGGLGFIGSNFVRHSLYSQKNCVITNIDNESQGSNHASLKEIESDRRYKFVKGDLADYSLVRKIVKKANVIVNFAAQTHVDRSISSAEPFFHSNVQSVFNLVRALRESSVPKTVIHISTDEVYGSIDEGSFQEESRFNPSSPYSATKAAAEMFVRAWNMTFNLGITTVRCTNNFGPFQHPEKFIPKAIIRGLAGESIPLYGGGGQIRDWIHVEDFCRAVSLAIEKGTPGGVYNISAGNEMTNREVARKLLHEIGSPSSKLVDVEDRPGHDARYSISSAKARRDLGWIPSKSFDDGLAETVRWYREHKDWWRLIATKKILSEDPWKKRW